MSSWAADVNLSSFAAGAGRRCASPTMDNGFSCVLLHKPSKNLLKMFPPEHLNVSLLMLGQSFQYKQSDGRSTLLYHLSLLLGLQVVYMVMVDNWT